MTHEFHSFYYDQLGQEPVSDDFTLPAGTVMDATLLQRLIDAHRENHLPRLRYLGEAYETHYEIFGRPKKEPYKPDNRLAADMAYDITETFEGYFIGVPVDVRHEEDAKDAYLADYMARNHQEDTDAELSKMCSKFGVSYEMFYQDDEGRLFAVDIRKFVGCQRGPIGFVQMLFQMQKAKKNMKTSHILERYMRQRPSLTGVETQILSVEKMRMAGNGRRVICQVEYPN